MQNQVQDNAFDDGRWIPKSGYGKYCTIPMEDGADVGDLERCGLGSFLQTRREMRELADGCIVQAIDLVEKAKQERLRLSRDVRGPNGERLIRPYRCRLWLDLDKADFYMYLGWRGLLPNGRGRGRSTGLSDCSVKIGPWIRGVHEEEAKLISDIEASAVAIRRRWFALVRATHYMNVVERHAVADRVI